MHYQLPNGKTIEIPTELYFDMTDEDLEYLIAYGYGEHIEDPFYGSVVSKHSSTEEEKSPDLTDLKSEEKLQDLDLPELDE